jgi:ribosomal protein S27E
MDTEPREESALQAAKAGRSKFLSHPCKKCGERLRYTSSRACVPCAIAKATAYQLEVRAALAANRIDGGRK